MSKKSSKKSSKSNIVRLPSISEDFTSLLPLPINRSPIISNKTILPSLKTLNLKEETPRTVIGSSSNRSMARPKTAPRDGKRKEGGRKTRKAKKSKKTRKNRKSKSKRKTRKTRRNN